MAGKLVWEYSEHSWFILAMQIRNKVRRLFTQAWWTYKSWQAAVKRGEGDCPKCGDKLCID